jgi:nicotinate-nucleotide pyrophosphorylase (carboxylating)
MSSKLLSPDRVQVASDVARALQEDLGLSGNGDLTAGLIVEDAHSRVRLLCRQEAILSGTAWFNEAFRQLGDEVRIEWSSSDGDPIAANTELCQLEGNTRALLIGERTALNFLQTLSGTATLTAHYVAAVAGTGVRILDTRKTLPGLRMAQKYAVRCGGGSNHRVGLFDAVLIKENHIMAAGSITAALTQAQQLTPVGVEIEIEVESLAEMQEALAAGARRILLDNFSLDELREAVRINNHQARLEASGGVTLQSLRAIAETGVDDISVGALTKDVGAIDLSMRFETDGS